MKKPSVRQGRVKIAKAKPSWLDRAVLALNHLMVGIIMLVALGWIGAAVKTPAAAKVSHVNVFVEAHPDNLKKGWPAGDRQMREIFSDLGFNTKVAKEQAEYIATVRSVLKESACIDGAVRDLSVRVETVVRDRRGNIAQQATSTTRRQLVSCESSRKREAIEDFLWRVVFDDEAYYMKVFLDRPLAPKKRLDQVAAAS